MLHHVTPGYTRLHHVTPGYTMLHQVTPCYTMLHHVTPGYTRLHQVTPCYTMLHHVTPGYTMLHHHHVTPGYTRLHHVTPSPCRTEYNDHYHPAWAPTTVTFPFFLSSCKWSRDLRLWCLRHLVACVAITLTTLSLASIDFIYSYAKCVVRTCLVSNSTNEISVCDVSMTGFCCLGSLYLYNALIWRQTWTKYYQCKCHN